MVTMFTKTHEVNDYECDVNGTMTLPALLRVVLKVSEKQSEALGLDTQFIRSFGVTWVVTNYALTVAQLPKVGETIQIMTCARSYNKYFCYRDFILNDQEGKELVKIEAVFALMDIEARKMRRVPEEVILPFDSEKMTKIKRYPKIPAIENGTFQNYRVRFYDIDSNQHVNNSIYFNWMIDVLGYDFLTQHRPVRINMRFDKEVYYGSEVTSHYEVIANEDQQSTIHAIKVGETLCCEAQIDWQTK